MKYNYSSKIGLYYFLIIVSAIYMQSVLSFILFRLNLKEKHKLLYSTYHIILIQYLISVISRRRLQVVSFILLSESLSSYLAYKKYLYRYKILFQQFIINNRVENNYHINNRHINIIAILYLRIISLSTDVNVKRLIWLYLFYIS